MDNNVVIELKISAKLGEDKKYETVISTDHDLRINGFRVINFKDINDALERFILRNCGDEEILNAIADNKQKRKQLAYNHNIPTEMADALADELCCADDAGTYPYEFCSILQNPKLSGKKLDYFANHFLEQHQYIMEVEDGRMDYEILYLLRYIARNPAVWESTLETLKRSEIPSVVEAAQR